MGELFQITNYDNDDLAVLRAVADGHDTRAQLKEVLGIGYDVIEKCIERRGDDLYIDKSGVIEKLHLKVSLPKTVLVEPVELAELDEPETPLCDCGKNAGHVGRCRGTVVVKSSVEGATFTTVRPRESDTNDSKAVIVEPEQPEPIPIESFDQRVEIPKAPTAASVHRLFEDLNKMDDFDWDKFFNLMNTKYDGIIWGVLEDNREVKQFHTAAYTILIRLLKPRMSQMERDAVWTLIQYVNREAP